MLHVDSFKAWNPYPERRGGREVDEDALGSRMCAKLPRKPPNPELTLKQTGAKVLHVISNGL